MPMMGFPGGSDSKESTCNAGDLGSILELGRSPGEDFSEGKTRENISIILNSNSGKRNDWEIATGETQK